MAKKTLMPETALKIIRTWAELELDNPEVDVLVPEHVIELCDEALGIVPEAGKGGGGE